MEIIFNGEEISSEKDFYDSLLKQVPEFGQYFGFNLDAFNDYIGLLEGKKIIWNNSMLSRVRLGDLFLEIIKLIDENNKINKDLGGNYIINLELL